MKEFNEVILLRLGCGSHEALYVNGQLLRDEHTIGEGDPISFWIDFAYEYNVRSEDIKQRYLTDEDDNNVRMEGCWPEYINEFTGIYK